MGGHVNTVWADEHSTALLAFLADGMSFSQSASALNEKFSTSYSRNAACGKAFRLNFKVPKRAKAVRKPRKRDRERVAAVKPKPRIEKVRIRCAEIHPQNVTLLGLSSDGCRYPSGDGPFLFCNHQQQDGSSYCPAHEDLCHSTAPRLSDEDRALRRFNWMKRRKILVNEAAA